jgi:hypothetical protein
MALAVFGFRGLAARDSPNGGGAMNSAAMATNLLGRAVRLRERPPGCKSDEGTIALVTIQGREVRFLVLVDGRLVWVEDGEQLRVLD